MYAWEKVLLVFVVLAAFAASEGVIIRNAITVREMQRQRPTIGVELPLWDTAPLVRDI